ncbi:MAG TPA: pyridoxal 5'-phosphate synthase [Pseudolysinimonas sp.]
MAGFDTLGGDESVELPEFEAPPGDPLRLLAEWFADAEARGIREPRVGTLATADPAGRVSARTLLTKEVTPEGIVFTSASSRKTHQLAANPSVALNFYWRETMQQLFVEGRAEALPDDESDRLFAERARDAQASAAASRQGEALAGEDELAAATDAVLAGDGPIDRPKGWRGYLVRPEAIEFWQGRRSRLHRRLRYELQPDGSWQARRLQP